MPSAHHLSMLSSLFAFAFKGCFFGLALGCPGWLPGNGLIQAGRDCKVSGRGRDTPLRRAEQAAAGVSGRRHHRLLVCPVLPAFRAEITLKSLRGHRCFFPLMSGKAREGALWFYPEFSTSVRLVKQPKKDHPVLPSATCCSTCTPATGSGTIELGHHLTSFCAFGFPSCSHFTSNKLTFSGSESHKQKHARFHCFRSFWGAVPCRRPVESPRLQRCTYHFPCFWAV